MTDADAPSSEVTRALRAVKERAPGAEEKLMELVYPELRSLAAGYMARERGERTLQPTDLVHEAWLKLARGADVDWQGRTHFFAVSARVMRRILVDRARARGADKRWGGLVRIELQEGTALSAARDVDVLAVDQALGRLEALDPRQARIVELRFFSGLAVQEVADAIGVSKRTVERELTVASAFLRRELSGEAR